MIIWASRRNLLWVLPNLNYQGKGCWTWLHPSLDEIRVILVTYNLVVHTIASSCIGWADRKSWVGGRKKKCVGFRTFVRSRDVELLFNTTCQPRHYKYKALGKAPGTAMNCQTMMPSTSAYKTPVIPNAGPPLGRRGLSCTAKQAGLSSTSHDPTLLQLLGLGLLSPKQRLEQGQLEHAVDYGIHQPLADPCTQP